MFHSLKKLIYSKTELTIIIIIIIIIIKLTAVIFYLSTNINDCHRLSVRGGSLGPGASVRSRSLGPVRQPLSLFQTLQYITVVLDPGRADPLSPVSVGAVRGSGPSLNGLHVPRLPPSVTPAQAGKKHLTGLELRDVGLVIGSDPHPHIWKTSACRHTGRVRFEGFPGSEARARAHTHTHTHTHTELFEAVRGYTHRARRRCRSRQRNVR